MFLPIQTIELVGGFTENCRSCLLFTYTVTTVYCPTLDA